MSSQDVAQEFVQWARGDLMAAVYAMAGCIDLARARVDCDRSMEGVPERARWQLRRDLRVPGTDTKDM